MNLIVTVVLLGNLTVTSYRSLPSQTDSSPMFTSTGAPVEMGGCAVSRDLLCPACMRLHRRCDHPNVKGKIHYGDILYIKDYGWKFCNDVMADYTKTKKYGKHYLRNRIDIWVKVYAQEKEVGVKMLPVWQIKGAVK